MKSISLLGTFFLSLWMLLSPPDSDVKGHGQSDKPTDVSQYGKALEEDVTRLMDHPDIEKAYVRGNSMGAFITGNLMVDHSERLLSATLIGGTPLTQTQFSPHHSLFKLLDDTAESLESGEGITPLLQCFWPDQDGPTTSELEQIHRQVMEGQDKEALQLCIISLKDLCQINGEKLSLSEVPVTLINGTDDPLKNYITPF